MNMQLLMLYRHGLQQYNCTNLGTSQGWIEDSPIEFLVDSGRGRRRAVTEMLRKPGRRKVR